MSEALSALTQVWTWISTNDALKILIWAAVGGVVISIFMGIFFRNR